MPHPPVARRIPIRALRLASVAVLMVALTPHRAAAQLGDAKVLTSAAVKTILAAAEGTARQNNWNVSIAVVDASGDLLGFLKLDGASAMSVQVAQGKARTSARSGQPTAVYANRVLHDTLTILSVDGVYTLQGGVPIRVNGRVIGAVGVSGVTSAQDEQVALAGVATVKP
jgi:glc operon protein GlcG